MKSRYQAPSPSGRRLLGDLGRLQDPDGVAEGVADPHVGAVEVVGRLLGEVGDAPFLQGLVQGPAVVRLEGHPADRAFRDELTDLRRRGLVVGGWSWLLEVDLEG